MSKTALVEKDMDAWPDPTHLWLVTRHAGAMEWLRRQVELNSLHPNAHVLRHINRVTERPHLDPDALARMHTQDLVFGVLPLAIVSYLTQKCHARCAVIEYEIQPARGVELTAEQMETHGAHLVEYKAQECGPILAFESVGDFAIHGNHGG